MKDFKVQFNEEEIVEKLKTLNPLKIILFGSYAYGTPYRDSDLDISKIRIDAR